MINDNEKNDNEKNQPMVPNPGNPLAAPVDRDAVTDFLPGSCPTTGNGPTWTFAAGWLTVAVLGAAGVDPRQVLRVRLQLGRAMDTIYDESEQSLGDTLAYCWNEALWTADATEDLPLPVPSFVLARCPATNPAAAARLAAQGHRTCFAELLSAGRYLLDANAVAEMGNEELRLDMLRLLVATVKFHGRGAEAA